MSQQQNTKSTADIARETVEFPMKQAIEYQRNLGQLVLSGLTMGDWIQSRGVEMTRQSLDNYLQTLQNTTDQMSQTATMGAHTVQNVEQAMSEMAHDKPQEPQQVGRDPSLTGGEQVARDAPHSQQPPQQSGQQPPQQSGQQPPQQLSQQPPQQSGQQPPQQSGQQPPQQSGQQPPQQSGQQPPQQFSQQPPQQQSQGQYPQQPPHVQQPGYAQPQHQSPQQLSEEQHPQSMSHGQQHPPESQEIPPSEMDLAPHEGPQQISPQRQR